MQPQLQTAYLNQTMPLENPFGWSSVSYTLPDMIKFTPDNRDLSYSFKATRISKFIGYLPFRGTVVGISRLVNAMREQQRFESVHLHHMSNRSKAWALRGLLEIVPIVGGVTCLIIDVAVSILYPGSHSIEPMPFRLCAQCRGSN